MKPAIVLVAVTAVMSVAVAAAPFSTPQVSAPPQATPSYETKSLSIQPGKTSAAIEIPQVNVPIRMMIAISTPGDGGVGEVTILRTQPATQLVWAGVDYATNTGGTAQVSSGTASNPGRHIVYADANGQVDIEVLNAKKIVVHNGSSIAQTAVLTFMW